MKKILIVSNNALSSINNNGKTLASFFHDNSEYELAQLFFSAEPVEDGLASCYFRVSDADVLSALKPFGEKAGKEVRFQLQNVELPSSNFIPKVSRSVLTRLLREIVWYFAPINLQALTRWVVKFNPDIIFFCAGDSLFAYNLYSVCCNAAPMAKKVVYVTDDYILPRSRESFFARLRRKMVFHKMKSAALEAAVFVTISEQMRSCYRELFGKDSSIAFNMPQSLLTPNFTKSERKDLVLVYLGGLHFKRWESLAALATSVHKFNLANNRSVVLKVFSHQEIDSKVVQKLEQTESCEFCGPLDVEGVTYWLNNADVLVHVESFSEDSIQSTRLSISTKIAEYISMNKPIVAIGPSGIASMSFLSSSACCINSLNMMDEKLESLLLNFHSFNVNYSELKNKIREDKIYFYKKLMSED